MSSYSVLEGGHSNYTCRVSSTLNRDTKQFGKKFLFDGREEICCNLDQVRLPTCSSSPRHVMANILY